MANLGASCINDWNQRRQELKDNVKKGLIAVAFDQRNHGTRQVDKVANESWRGGNERHAQDMFSIFHGTVMDTSLLINHLESYVFHDGTGPHIEQHLVLGISLGGHAAWQVLFSDSRITAAVVIIGCPDYIRIMTDRARLSKLPTYISSNGAHFLGSKDFPNALVNSIKGSDPRGLLFGTDPIPASTPSPSSQTHLRKILDSRLRAKRVLVCSGGDDKLVPYHSSEPFMAFLKNATGAEGWYKDGNVYVEDNIYAGIGHAMSEDMVKDSMRFVSDTLAGTENCSRTPSSKI